MIDAKLIIGILIGVLIWDWHTKKKYKVSGQTEVDKAKARIKSNITQWLEGEGMQIGRSYDPDKVASELVNNEFEVKSLNYSGRRR